MYGRTTGVIQKCKGGLQKCKGGIRVLLPPSQSVRGQYGSVRVEFGKYGRLHVEATLG